jgi:malate synthase
VLIETLPAAFEMDEILYELREHSAGLNCGRWDYIFSFIKKLRDAAAARSRAADDGQAFLRAYSQLLIKTCHRRGAHAMGGMAAQIPIKDDPAPTRRRSPGARRQAARGDRRPRRHLGRSPRPRAGRAEIFDAHMKGPNQLDASARTWW